MKKILAPIMTFVLAGMLTLAFSVEPVKVQGESTPSTVTSSGLSTFLPQRSIVQLGGYYYVFYITTEGINKGYLCYRSSTDGSVWGSENVASHAPTTETNLGDYDVFADRSTIYVAYPVGSYSTSNMTSSTGYVRTGTQSNGMITWNTEVQITHAGGFFEWSFARTANRTYLALRAYADGWWYHVNVYYSVDYGSSWTEIFDYMTGDRGYPLGIAISSWDFQYADGVVLVDGEYWAPYFNYWTFDGSDWSGKSTFGSKISSAYVYHQSMSMVTHKNQVHFAYIKSVSGGSIFDQYFTTSWSSPTTVDSSVCLDPSLSATPSSLYLVYRIGSALYYRAMDYASDIWDSSATLFVSGEISPFRLTSEKYSTTDSIGVVWRSGSPTPSNVRFARISYSGVPTLVASLDIDPDSLNLRSKANWITIYIQLPEGYNPADIDASTIFLNRTITPVLDPTYDFVTNSSESLVDHSNDGILERMVKFDKLVLESWIYQSVGMQHEVSLIITGLLSDGTPFEGTSSIFAFWQG